MEGQDVEVWVAKAGDSRALTELLNADERVYAGKLARAEHRNRYATAHAMLRSVLAARTSEHPTAIRIARLSCHRCGGPHGKPFLADDPSTTFSLSDSGDIATVAVASGRELGIDVEDLSRKRDVAGLAKRTLSAEE